MAADSKPAADDTLLGRRVGGYTVTRRVGQGGMGVVYEAQHERIGQRAAVKVLHKELSADEKVLQRFFNEAKAISVAQHSSIVKIFDYGQLEDGTAYIMMEFLDGEPLLTRMERAQSESQGLPINLVVELGRQIAAALGVIHLKGIVHRDLKPENIFIVPDPVAPLGERVKLLDFGIAKFLDGPVRKTTVGMILGTPLYMSPEQCEGSEDLDAKVDVYALGVILYEMVAGHLPFIADTAAALMRQHMFKEPPPLEDQVVEMPAELATLVHEMLAKKPSDRPDMPAIAGALESLQAQLSGHPGNSNAPRSISISARRKQITVGGDAGSADPFASTMGGVDGAAVATSGRVKAPTDPFARTMADSPGKPSGQRSLPPKTSGELPAGLPPPPAELDLHAELGGPPQPIGMTAAGSASARGRLLPVLVPVIIAAVLALGLGAMRLFSSPHADTTPAAGSTPSQPAAGGATGHQPAAQPPGKDAAKSGGPAAGSPTTDAEGDESADSRKSHGKKSRQRAGGKKRSDEGEPKKATGRPEGHDTKSHSGDEPDVWR